MGFFTALAAKAVGERFAPLLVGFTVLLALGLALWWLRNDAYQDGVSDTDAKWVEAGDRLKEQAAEARAGADAQSETRTATEIERVRTEKEKIDEAEAAGTSTLDSLFGA